MLRQPPRHIRRARIPGDVRGKLDGAQSKASEATWNPVRGMITDDDGTAGAEGIDNLKGRRFIRREERPALPRHAVVPDMAVPPMQTVSRWHDILPLEEGPPDCYGDFPLAWLVAASSDRVAETKVAGAEKKPPTTCGSRRQAVPQ